MRQQSIFVNVVNVTAEVKLPRIPPDLIPPLPPPCLPPSLLTFRRLLKANCPPYRRHGLQTCTEASSWLNRASALSAWMMPSPLATKSAYLPSFVEHKEKLPTSGWHIQRSHPTDDRLRETQNHLFAPLERCAGYWQRSCNGGTIGKLPVVAYLTHHLAWSVNAAVSNG